MRFLLFILVFSTISCKKEVETKAYNYVEGADIKMFDYNELDSYIKNHPSETLVVNFWATWCAPCREEMPSLDNLQVNLELNNLKIFPINIGREDISKSESFFKELNIKNLDIYFDSPITLAKKFSLRGVPTTIFFNKKGEEFARLIGSIDFNDEGFIKWLKNYN